MVLPMTGQYLRAIKLLRNEIGENSRSYPFSLPIFSKFDELEFDSCVTIIVGENGAGKSTLLEAIAVAWGFNPEGGTRDMKFTTQDTHSNLYEYIRLIKGVKKPNDGYFLRAESFYNVATQADNYGVSDYYGGSLHLKSHGEAFFATLMNKFRGKGFYLLDEPEAALSPMRQMAILSRIHELVENESQFIIATHSPIIMAYPGAKILQLSDNGIEAIEYEDTEHYRITKQFINNRESILKVLME
ncbi:atpase aaa-type core [Lucifera butyrica]|uniref:Atpase aaa-type core n=1 Tax=Lucifera butyrica TaxID=1351585 RepID=A0A498R3L2_9FIRM|nr:AAA family ATPase [Lucifera butyrica]VBB04872.1 atpase aaa-type core [Lucifera butyrica]